MKSIQYILLSIFILIFSFLDISTAQHVSIEEETAEGRKISIEDVSRIALSNSLDIQIAKFDAYMKRTSLGKAESIFDTFINAGTDYRHNEKKQPSIIFGTKTMTNTYSAGANKKLPIGTDLQLNIQHIRTATDSPFETLNPSHEPIVGISLQQPIGKNFFGMADRGLIKITKLDIKNSDYTSLNNIENALYEVQSGYWKLALKGEELKIKKDMLKEAQRLYETYQKKFNIGMVEKADLLAMEANVAIRENDVLITYLEQNTSKNDLLFLLNESNIDINLIPLDNLEVLPKTADINSALMRATENRRDYKKIKNAIKANKIDLSIKKNALWPEIDLAASLTRNGLSSDYKEAWDDITDENNRELFVGVTFNIPLENNKARAELKEAKYGKQKLILTLKQIERLILRQLNNKIEEINTLKNQINLFTTLLALQKSKLMEEEKRLKFGRSSSDLIVRYENDLLEARLSLARSYFKYRVSLIELDVLENTLLNKYWEGEL